MLFNSIAQQSYYIDIDIDVGFDNIYFITRYHFQTNKLTLDFIEHIKTLQNILPGYIFYSKKNL
jgi:hypothetical protein